VAVLAEAVDDGQDHRLPVDPGQRFDEVEADVCPNSGRNRQWHDEAGWKEVLRLVSLTSGTHPHKILHNAAHVGEVEVATKSVQCALDALVAIVMDSRHDFLQEG